MAIVLPEGIFSRPVDSADAKIEHLTKVVRVLWHEVEHMRRFISFGPSDISVKVGDASVTLKKDGSVTIRGNNVVVEAASRVNIKAAGNVVIKGANIA